MNGVLFGEKHSYRDWGLILKTRPVISPPSPKTKYIDIPESNGQLDLTESLTGEVQFENREITCEFNVIAPRERWTALYSEILNYLHGQQLKVVFDEDPSFFYTGRFTVDEWKSDRGILSVLVISGTVEPFKCELTGSLEDWIWDNFNFENGYIREYADLAVDGELDFVVQGSRKSSVPSFIVKSEDGTGMMVAFQGNSYALKDGTNRVVSIVIKDGSNELKFTGNGTVSIGYQGGSL